MGFMDTLLRIGSTLGLATIEEVPVGGPQQNVDGYPPSEQELMQDPAYYPQQEAPAYPQQAYQTAPQQQTRPQQEAPRNNPQQKGFQQGYQPPRGRAQEYTQPPQQDAYQETQTYAPQQAADGRGAQQRTAAGAPQEAAPAARQKKGNDQVLIVYVRRVEDAQHYISALLSGYVVLLNMEEADQNVGPRVLDQLTGATFALNGSLAQVSRYVFVMTPPEVKITDSERTRMRPREAAGARR